VAPGALDKLDGPARDVAELARRFEAQLEEGKVADRRRSWRSRRARSGDSPSRCGRCRWCLLDVPIAAG